MPCECLTYECLSVKFDPCNEFTELPLTAPRTGLWVMEIEFNGMWQQINIEALQGQSIIIPVSVLNESYTHKAVFYDADGNQINDTCYKLKSRSMIGAPIPPDVLEQIFAELAEHSEEIAELQDDVIEINEAIEAIEADLGRVLRVFEFTVPNGPSTDPFTLTSTEFAGKTVWIIGFYSTSAYQRNQAFTQSGNTITMTQGDAFNIGDVLNIYYD